MKLGKLMICSAIALVIGNNSVKALAQLTADPVGNWMFEDSESAVEFYPCGDALCGKISWLKVAPGKEGQIPKDIKNPDPALRDRTVCGLEFITSLKAAKSGGWENGRIYSIGGGTSYDLEITKVEPMTLQMRGFKGVRFLGQSFTLTRAPADLPRCATSAQ